MSSALTCDPASALLVRVEHHAQDAVDAEPEVPEAGVGRLLVSCGILDIFPRFVCLRLVSDSLLVCG